MQEWISKSIDIVTSDVISLENPVRKVEKAEYEVVNYKVEVDDGLLSVSGKVQGEIVFYGWTGGREKISKFLDFDERIPIGKGDNILDVAIQPVVKDSFVRVNGRRKLFQHVLVGVELDFLEEMPKPEQMENESMISEVEYAENAGE